ncbi:Uu.00g085630.m01.CDS01 [Anthostomella pinea]|uniref:Uu.00g085630.m01.CDS01 n=1 Tax=Anthostomella pinea TaxID=933095 RepID=A0AAI8VMM7_9PEZI|nr:Uu.00g085630.m01.CDS01 [Anthostomella pinea]
MSTSSGSPLFGAVMRSAPNSLEYQGTDHGARSSTLNCTTYHSQIYGARQSERHGEPKGIASSREEGSDRAHTSYLKATALASLIYASDSLGNTTEAFMKDLRNFTVGIDAKEDIRLNIKELHLTHGLVEYLTMGYNCLFGHMVAEI